MSVPNILAIETSSRAGSVVLATGPTVVGEHVLRADQRHAAELMPAIERLTRAAGWAPGDIGHLYLSIGPGSFTGLRIAVALARSLAHALGTKIVAVPSLDVIAENAPPEFATVVPILDAKRGQVFTALYVRGAGGMLERQGEPRLMTLAEIAAEAVAAAPVESTVALLGEGLEYHQQAVPASGRFVQLPKELWTPQARTVHRLGWALAQAGGFADPATLLPTYIRLPEAEEVYRKKHGLPL
jgi:tRNA threonylcarbamoyladenosine biosynthesis protein TsaB